jgi:hypothetical protein
MTRAADEPGLRLRVRTDVRSDAWALTKEQEASLDKRAAAMKSPEDVAHELIEYVTRAGSWASYSRSFAKGAGATGAAILPGTDP